MTRNPWWMERFETFGIRLTSPRKIIVKLLHDTDAHLSAEEIFMRAHVLNSSIGLTTVYRTLELLVQIGVVQKFDFGDKKARYELTDRSNVKGHHHHLVCMGCKTIIDYSDYIKDELDMVQKAEAGLAKKHRFQIMGHIIRFYGMCENCRSQKQI